MSVLRYQPGPERRPAAAGGIIPLVTGSLLYIVQKQTHILGHEL